MDTVSSLDLVRQKTEIPKKHLIDIFEDPKKTLYFMLIVGAVLALIFIIYSSVSSSLVAKKEVEKLQQNPSQEKNEVTPNLDPKRKEDVSLLKTAIDNYYSRNKTYPPSISSLVPNFLGVIPRDPENQKEYFYRVSLDYKSYEVWALLDDNTEFILRSP